MADGIDIVVRDRISASITRKIRDIGNAATSAEIKLERLRNSLNIGNLAGTSNVNTALNRVKSSADGATNSVRRLNSSNLARLRASAEQTASAIARLESRALAAGRTIRTIASVGLLAGTAGAGLEKLDAFRTLENQLRTVTSSEKQLNEVTSRLFDVATAARVPVEDLTRSFRRFDIALKDTGAGQKESLRITETIAKAMVLSGATSGEAASSLLQLSQAFNKGKLDGDEFRSVAENIPGILTELSNTMGIAKKSIFDASQKGKITIDVLRQTFARLAEQVDADFARMPKTIGQAFTQLTNSITRFFGAFDQQFKIVDKMVAFIDYLSANI
ncbi:MAG: tape measure protein, partial [Microbacteriaceae bacterium]|nr:tape measure protein [Microbacteriaceae bacterium]